jgi:hypothetical protein
MTGLTPVAVLQEMWFKLQEKYADRRRPDELPRDYAVEKDWERALHAALGLGSPCGATSEFRTVYASVIGELEASGIRAGPASFDVWNDGDAAFGRAIWCLVRHLRPRTVIETGVAHGVTSRLILEALERNGSGHLWSIDLPPKEHVWHKEVGIAVGDRFRDKWTYMRGSSRRLLPGLVARLGELDLFIHDSLHSDRNVRFELGAAFGALKQGSAIVVDDVDVNWGFRAFERDFSGFEAMVCEAEPVRPDLRRFNHKGLFGIILKNAAAKAFSAAQG